MNVTLDIPDDVLRLAMLASGTESAQEAVLKALEEFVSGHDPCKLLSLFGKSDGFMSPEELDEMRGMD